MRAIRKILSFSTLMNPVFPLLLLFFLLFMILNDKQLTKKERILMRIVYQGGRSPDPSIKDSQ